jgi:hypothetical protein
MNRKTLVMAAALTLGMATSAAAGVGCKPGNAHANTKVSDCGPGEFGYRYHPGMSSYGAAIGYARPAPVVGLGYHAYGYEPYPYGYAPRYPVAGVSVGPVGVGVGVW